MKKFRCVLLCGLAGAVLGGLAWVVFDPARHEPQYEGRTLSQYLEVVVTNWPNPADEQTMEAIYRMGPATIPYLRHDLREMNSPRERALRFIHTKFPASLARHLPAPKDVFYLTKLSAASARCLAIFGPQAQSALPDLIECLNDVRTMNSALSAIQEIGPQPEDVPTLLALLNSTNSIARIYAVYCLANAGATNAEVLEPIIKMAAKGDVRTRPSAIYALSRLGTNNVRVAEALAENLTDSSALIRITSAEVLRQIQAKAAPPVGWFVKELDEEINHGSAASSVSNTMGEDKINLLLITRALQEMGSEAQAAAPLLRSVKDHEQISLRLMAVEALWRINHETNDFVAIHREALKYFDPNLRIEAAKGLSEYCIEQKAGLPELEEMLSSNDLFTRLYGAQAMWKLTGETEREVPILIAALSDHTTYYHNAEFRKLAADTLAEMGAKARPAIPALVATLTDVREEVRVSATNALKRIDPEAGTKAR